MRSHVSTVAALTIALAPAAIADAQSAGIAGSEWRPTLVEGVEAAADAGMFARFGGNGEVQGDGGCNRFFGTYRVHGDEIAIGPLAATRMACPDPVMANEARFFRALDRVRRFSRQRIDLVLTDDAGHPLIVLVQTDAD